MGAKLIRNLKAQMRHREVDSCYNCKHGHEFYDFFGKCKYIKWVEFETPCNGKCDNHDRLW